MSESDTSDKYSIPGERLTHLLDQIGFESGRGRTRALYNLIVDSSLSEFADLKFGTVRSWFHNHASTMRKVSNIIDLLSQKHTFEQDKEQVAVWWKVGGYYPYESQEPSLDRVKIETLVATNIQESIDTNGLQVTKELEQEVQDAAITLCKQFADPAHTECPTQYIEMLIRDKLRSS